MAHKSKLDGNRKQQALFNAAPDLLAACEDTLDAYEAATGGLKPGRFVPNYINMMLDAVHKAKGGK